MKARDRRGRRLLRLGSIERDLDEELSFHFQATVDELMSRGLSRQQAEDEAARRFGDETSYRRQLERIDRDVAVRRRWSERLDATRQSMAYAIRSLSRTPTLSIGVILAFALGIGANAVMYGIVDRLLLTAPPHIADVDAVRRLNVDIFYDFLGRRTEINTMTYPDYRDWQAAKTFSVAAYAARRLTVGRGMDAHEQHAVFATAQYFELLGVQPALGRFYTSAEDRIGGPPTVVLGWSAWQREYGGGRDVIGQTIDFGYGAYEIIGVTPKGFTGVDLAPVDLWLPLHVVSAQTTGTDWQDARDWFWFSIVARLTPGVTEAEAMAEATALHVAARRELIESKEYGTDPRVVLASVLFARGAAPPGEATVAKLLFAVSLIVLLIAALNVANLLLARTIQQRREIAVRLALGISRRRLVSQIALEGVVLALGGGIAAVLLAQLGTPLLGALLLPGVLWEGTSSGSSVALVALGLALVAGLLSGLVPALQATRGQLQDALRRAAAGGVTRTAAHVRTTLALVQTALSVLLLIGAGLFVRSLDRVRHADLGIDPHNLLYVQPRAPRGVLNDADRIRIYHEAAARLAQLPGVRAVAMSTMAPFNSSRSKVLRAEGVDSIRSPNGGPYVLDVSPSYFAAMDLRVVQGRGITAADTRHAPRVAVVSAAMARGFWPTQSALGKCLYIGVREKDGPPVPCSTVVGVAEDSRRQTVRAEESFMYYVPIAQAQVDSIPAMLMVRAANATPQLENLIRRTMIDVDGRIRYAQVDPMMQILSPQLRSWELGATMFSIFGLLALLVAAIGLYSVLAFDVAQRTREIGVRAALGASSTRLIRMILERALGMTAIGVTLGTVAALALVNRIEPLLFETPARDPITFAAVITLLHLVAAAASTLPGWRAASVAPNEALRSE